MSCNHPFKGFFTGYKTDNGKDDYIICMNTASDLLSYESALKRHKRINHAMLKSINGHLYLTDPVPIPCGTCVGCRMERAKQWKVRLCHEAENYKDETWFVTLTYDNAHLPITPDGELTLVKRDLQLFMKRLRKYSGRKWRFFACGEYGMSENSTHRPHYHMILFGKLDDSLRMVEPNVYKSSMIDEAWNLGLTDVRKADPGTMAYVAGYVEKKQMDPYWESYPVKPFLLMSRKPGIGASKIKPLDDSFKVYGNFGESHYYKIPQYWRKKLDGDPRLEHLKEFCKHQGDIAKANQCFNDEERCGDIKDRQMIAALNKKRKESL